MKPLPVRLIITQLGREASLMAPCIASDSRLGAVPNAEAAPFVRPFHSETDSLGEPRDHG